MMASAAVTTGARARCSPEDLRLQWSSAYSRRHSDPAALERLRGRVAATLGALTEELKAATLPAARAALSAQAAEVRAVAAAIARVDARDGAAANETDGLAAPRSSVRPGSGDDRDDDDDDDDDKASRRPDQ